MCQNIVKNSNKMIKTNESNPTEKRIKLLNVFILIEEIPMGRKLKTTPESEKFDIAMGGKSESESDEESYKSKYETKGQELKLMTPKQMITRLPILLAQLKAGHNSKN